MNHSRLVRAWARRLACACVWIRVRASCVYAHARLHFARQCGCRLSCHTSRRVGCGVCQFKRMLPSFMYNVVPFLNIHTTAVVSVGFLLLYADDIVAHWSVGVGHPNIHLSTCLSQDQGIKLYIQLNLVRSRNSYS